MLRYHAHGKINLALDVVDRRSDGYHEVRTVLQSIALCDVIEVHPAGQDITLTCSDPALSTGQDNLILRAASALREAWDCRKGARIHLTKRLPTQAGLGGGSADAAVALMALSRLWRLPSDVESLLPLARGLGSDVPFFLVGGTALGVGRGDEVYPLPDAPRFHLVIAKPSRGTSTAEAYAFMDRELTYPQPVSRMVSLVNRLVEGKADERLFFNRFEEVVGHGTDEGSAVRQVLLDGGASAAMLAGSGSCWVGFFQHRSGAQEAYRRMAHRGIIGWLTSTVARKDYWELTLPRSAKETLP